MNLQIFLQNWSQHMGSSGNPCDSHPSRTLLVRHFALSMAESWERLVFFRDESSIPERMVQLESALLEAVALVRDLLEEAHRSPL